MSTEQPRFVDATAIDHAFGGAASFGEFFQISRVPGTGQRAKDDWISVRALAFDSSYARRRVERARILMTARLGLSPATLPDRVLGSIVFLGLAARLVAPSFGALLARGVSVELSLDDTFWQDTDGAAMPLSTTSTRGLSAAAGAASPRLISHLFSQNVVGLIEPILQTFAVEFSISRQVLWGNVASGIGGAARACGLAQPPVTVEAIELARALLALGPLSDTADSSAAAGPGWVLVRRSCCLFYRVPGAGTCADCVLNSTARNQQNAADIAAEDELR